VSELVCSRVENNAFHVMLSRSQRGNALSPELVEALINVLDSAVAASARLLILEGSGRHFCTGIDLADVGKVGDADLLQRFVRIEQLLDRIWRAPFLTIAVAKGRAIGAGADLFVACDVRLAVEGSHFAFPGAGFGIVLGTRRLAARTRPDLAMEIVLSGRAVPAREAAVLGLATRCLMPEEIEAALMAAEETARRCPAGTVARIRQAAYGDERAAADDLAALAASAAHSGLRERILAYREALRANSDG